MAEVIKEWWAVIVAFLGGAAWLGRLQSRLKALESADNVTVIMCNERRAGCKLANSLQFASGEKQFQKIEALIASNAKESRERHDELVGILLQEKK